MLVLRDVPLNKIVADADGRGNDIAEALALQQGAVPADAHIAGMMAEAMHPAQSQNIRDALRPVLLARDQRQATELKDGRGMMGAREKNATAIGYGFQENKQQAQENHSYGDLNRFPIYFGTHPAVMKSLIAAHPISQQDWGDIGRQYWWNPAKWLRLRYKTGRRVKVRIS